MPLPRRQTVAYSPLGMIAANSRRGMSRRKTCIVSPRHFSIASLPRRISVMWVLVVAGGAYPVPQPSKSLQVGRIDPQRHCEEVVFFRTPRFRGNTGPALDHDRLRHPLPDDPGAFPLRQRQEKAVEARRQAQRNPARTGPPSYGCDPLLLTGGLIRTDPSSV